MRAPSGASTGDALLRPGVRWVIISDAALHDPAEPTRFRGAYDSGDHLHPSPAGMAAIAAAVDLAWFR